MENEQIHTMTTNQETETQSTQKHNKKKEKEYTKIIGLKGKVSRQQILQQIRLLLMQYDPKKVEVLHPERQEYAEEKSRKIMDAYDFFKVKYNIT